MPQDPKKIMILKALLVETNIKLRKKIKEILESKLPSVGVFEAADEKEIFKHIKLNQPDVIIMDIRLANKNGLKLTKKIKRLYPHITVVINTNYDSMEYRIEAAHIGVDHFLSKKSNTIDDLVALAESLY